MWELCEYYCGGAAGVIGPKEKTVEASKSRVFSTDLSICRSKVVRQSLSIGHPHSHNGWHFTFHHGKNFQHTMRAARPALALENRKQIVANTSLPFTAHALRCKRRKSDDYARRSRHHPLEPQAIPCAFLILLL